MPNTVRFHRVLRTGAEKIYKAFIDPDAMAKWLPPNGFTGKVHEMDARVGGGYRMSFTNFSTSKSKDTRYVDIHEGDQLDEAQMATWVKQASALPGWVP